MSIRLIHVAILVFAVASVIVPAKADVASGTETGICAKPFAVQTRNSSQLGDKLQRLRLADDRAPASCCNATVKTCCK
jgi:hypothetical protein